MIKDSGNRTKFESGAVRDIQEGKGRCDLLPLIEVGEWVEPEHPLNIFTMVNEYRKSPSVNKMRVILDTFAAERRRGEVDIMDLEDLKKYRYELILEVSKHFEEGAKKYGDRNWEKGIPCDRYIDSAIRHYLKWRAGWSDEPHDRAFMWNILCCEWTRMEYGWNLEELENKSESDLLRHDLTPEEKAYVDHDIRMTEDSHMMRIICDGKLVGSVHLINHECNKKYFKKKCKDIWLKLDHTDKSAEGIQRAMHALEYGLVNIGYIKGVDYVMTYLIRGDMFAEERAKMEGLV